MFTPTNSLDNKLPKPFDKLKVKEEEEILIERYGGKESLSPGTRVVKGPGYDQSKINAVEGNYIGTILRVELEKKVQTIANIKENAAKESENTTSETEEAKAKAEKTDGINASDSENPTNIENVEETALLRENKDDEKLESNREQEDVVKKSVEIHWDNGKREPCTIGPELQLYERSNLIREEDIQCDGCKDYPLQGIRWTCITCNTTNLCTPCYMADKENSHHIYKRLVTKGSTGLEMPSRSQSAKKGKRKEVRGITLGSKVSLPKDNMQGTVLRFVKENVCRYMFQDNDMNVIDPKTIQRRYDDAKKLEIPLPEALLPKLTREMVENLQEIRVVMPLKDKAYVAGTVVSYKETDEDDILKIRVHWDAKRNEVKRFFNVSNDNDSKDFNTLYLFEHGTGCLQSEECAECRKDLPSSQTDVAVYLADSPIKRPLWTCTLENCSKRVCSLCYITAKHECDGTLEWGFNTYRFTGKPKDKAKDANLYIFTKGDEIEGKKYPNRHNSCLRSNDQTKEPKVKIHETSYILPVLVKNQDGEVFLRDISDMKVLKSKNNDKASVFFYQDHLPVLGGDVVEHYVANIETGTKEQKIQVQVWQTGSPMREETKSKTSQTFRPSLYYIVNDDNNQRHEYQGVSSSLCHFVSEKILIGKKLLGEYKTCCVHRSTSTEVVQELVEESYTIFKMRDIRSENDGSQIEHFKKMAEDIMGEKTMPVLITLTGLTKEKLPEAEYSIPVIYLKKSFVYVLWNGLEPEADSQGNFKNNIFQVDFQQPWIITRLDSEKVFLSPPYKGDRYLDSDQNSEDFDLRIALILTGVIMHMLKEKARKPLQGKDIAVRLMEKIPLYMTSLPVQVLKAGRWNFPGSYVMETLDKIFDHNSIQYIFEKNMEEEFKNGMWEDLKETTESAYQPPNFADKKLELSKDCRILDLVFYALLKTKRLDGARQLLETGCVGIRPILIGCKILKDFSEDWRVGILEEKELDRLRRMFGRHALSIMNYIHEKDEKDKPEEPKDLSEKVMTFIFKKKDDVNNAGRLLLNHGYLDVAYKTENEWFLENSKLKTIIKELWKGKGYKKQGRRWAMTTTFLLFLLHVFIMPLLLVNLDKPPLTWFYKKYHTPILKLWINMVGVFFFLAAFAYMLLFDYSEETVSRSELAILFWVACKFVDELEQVIVAIKRKKQIPDAVKMYLSDTWNHLDWLIIIACTLGAILKLFDDDLMEGAAKLLYISAYVMLNIRILNMFWTSEFLGTQLVIIQKMFGNTVAFMAIVLVIMMCYNVVDHALLFPNTEFSWAEVESIIKNGYWTLYGEFGDDVGTDCTNNATIYKAGLQERCPTSLGSAISPYLRAVYCLIAVVMLLNLLIAIYSYTAAIVHENSRMHWSQLQSNFLEEYTIRNIFPIHFKLLSAAAFVIHLVLSPVLKCVTNKKGQPAYERVLLYDESYDVIQKETEEAEKNGILEMQGKLEIDTDQFPEGSMESDPTSDILQEMEPLKDEMKEIKREMKELKEDMKNLLTINSKILRLHQNETTSLSPQTGSKL